MIRFSCNVCVRPVPERKGESKNRQFLTPEALRNKRKAWGEGCRIECTPPAVTGLGGRRSTANVLSGQRSLEWVNRKQRTVVMWWKIPTSSGCTGSLQGGPMEWWERPAGAQPAPVHPTPAHPAPPGSGTPTRERRAPPPPGGRGRTQDPSQHWARIPERPHVE